MRVGFQTLASLALCAAAAGAALAHYAIDVVGDYALARDSYDHLEHGSRELVTGIALVVAVALATRGLRICCEIATLNRGRLTRPAMPARDTIGFFIGAVAASAVMVPAMECLDGGLAGAPVLRIADAFGGSVLLGLGTTVLCAGLVALLVFAVARWLISHRDSIATMIETLLRRFTGPALPNRYALAAHRFAPHRRQIVHGLRLSKRGPPATSFV